MITLSGVALVQAIAGVYDRHFSTAKILAASVRDVHQVGRCFDAGAEICTIPPKVFWGMYKHVLNGSRFLEQFPARLELCQGSVINSSTPDKLAEIIRDTWPQLYRKQKVGITSH